MNTAAPGAQRVDPAGRVADHHDRQWRVSGCFFSCPSSGSTRGMSPPSEDGRGTVLARHAERRGRAGRDHALGAHARGRRPSGSARARRRVDDQDHAVVGLERRASHRRRLLDAGGGPPLPVRRLGHELAAHRRGSIGASSDALGEREEQRELAALAGVDSTWISPPSRRAISREIDRPRPVPPYLREVVPSACWKASKIAASLSSGIPTPGVDDRERRSRALLAQRR